MLALRRTMMKSASIAVRAGLVNATGARAMSMFYTKEHEYIKVSDCKKFGTIGISNFAQEALGDLVYCDLPAEGTAVTKGSTFGAVESTKTASDVYSPVTGVVTKVNEQLSENVALINSAAETDGWMIQVSMNSENDLIGLMDEAAYKAYVATLEH